MTTIIFIHGTGVRETEYQQTFKLITEKIHAQRPDIKVEPCLWSKDYGTKLAANGASIPKVDETLAINQELESENIILWQQLYYNPLYELQLLALKPQNAESANPFEEAPGDILNERAQSLTIEGEHKSDLELSGIAEIFPQVRDRVINSEPYQQILPNVSSESFNEYSDAVARAIVAAAMNEANANSLQPPILIDAFLRDEFIRKITLALSDEELGIGSWVRGKIAGLATNYIVNNRVSITDKISPIPCDILLYQTRGKKIRDFILDKIKSASPPVVLIAHSLGGIACVDLLVENSLPSVELLITAGSQAPFLYEINALSSLEFGQPLPQHFPKWINFYDQRDILSYIGGKLFNSANRNIVRDIEVISKLPFPQSHSAYWTNSTTWSNIFAELQ